MDVWAPMLSILLGVGLALAIGIEREFFAKAAGMRTYTLVGMGSALFTVVSKYGFLDTVMADFSRFDGSRVAAQVVSGIGFLGAGLIFVRRDSVRGLTTAAGIWFVAAIGMACGAGMHMVAVAATCLYLAIMFGIRPLSHRMPHARSNVCTCTVRYLDGRGVLRDIMQTISEIGLKVIDLRVLDSVDVDDTRRIQEVRLEVEGSVQSMACLGDDLEDLPGVELALVDASRFRSAPPD